MVFRMTRKSLLLRLGLLGVLALPVYLYSAGPVKERLLTSVRNPPRGLPGENDPAKRRRLVRINPSWLVRSEKAAWVGPHAQHTIKLFDDTEITLVIDRTQFKEKGRFTVFGHVDGVKDSRVVLAFYRGSLNGFLLIPGVGSFVIRSTSQGFHWILERDPNAYFECEVLPPK